jgi:hypothetical protein
MPDENDFVRITNREIYDAIISLRDRVAGVENRVDAVLTENVDLRKRIRTLELRSYSILAGLITMIPMMARMGGVL